MIVNITTLLKFKNSTKETNMTRNKGTRIYVSTIDAEWPLGSQLRYAEDSKIGTLCSMIEYKGQGHTSHSWVKNAR